MKTSLAPLPRVLIVEPDPSRAAMLDQMLRPSFTFELEIALNADEAIRSMTRALPSLVMTSTLLAPGDAALITQHLRQLSAAGRRLPMVDLPYALSQAVVRTSSGSSGGFGRWFRRSSSPPAQSGLPTLRQHIEEYLSQALFEAPLLDPFESPPAASSEDLSLVSLAPADTLDPTWRDPAGSALADRADRRRARRRRVEELPVRWELKLLGAYDVDIVNISTSGVLLETGMRIVPGTVVHMQLLGLGRQLSVPARLLRSEPVSADARTARYRVAAAFGRELGILEAPPGLAEPRSNSIAPAEPRTDSMALVEPDSDAIADVLKRAEEAIDRAFDSLPASAGW